MFAVSRPLVLYHANCADGLCAAWSAWRVFGGAADYQPVCYGQSPPDVRGRNVYILDFSYKRPDLLGMVATARRLVLLDHHKTAQADLDGVGAVLTGQQAAPPHVVFDMNKSGARLAWEHFHPGQESPWLVDYVEDRDLWRWQLADSRAVSAGIASRPLTFEQFDEYFDEPGPPGLLVMDGKAILRYQANLIDTHVRNAVEVEMAGERVLAVNATCLFSDIAGKLAESRPFGVAWFVRQDGKVQVSLRSRGEGGADVSEVAKRYGGGGHRNAAGFEVEADSLIGTILE